MAIIISKRGQNATRVERTRFEREDYLQEYILQNPESIPLYDIEEDIRLLILAREFATDSGPIDVLGVDKEGEIYLVETKLYKNPDKRQVVAQVLDYGASLWSSSQDSTELVRLLDRKVTETRGIALSQCLKEFFGIDDEEVAVLLDNLRRNLSEGNFKFVVLMDRLYQQLKDLVVFLNQNSKFTLYAVELEFYRYEDYEVLIPKLFGAEVKKGLAVQTTSAKRRRWDEAGFFQDARSKLDESHLTAVRKLYDFSKGVADRIDWGTGTTVASFNVKFDKVSVRSLYTVKSNGELKLNFAWLDDNETATRYRDDFKARLDQIKELTIPGNYRELWLAIPGNEWCPVLDKFIGAVRGLIGSNV